LTIPSKVVEVISQPQNNSDGKNTEQIADSGEKSQEGIWSDELNDSTDMKNEGHNPVTGTLIFYLLEIIWLNELVFVK
ncbi:unnamed protein product, partial [Onchocerca flexuosa]|uniref:Ovule protein n=1 Tax=Onchocerca flexuosa TaxID=387005 RepID=A0A183H8P6_9BILA